VRAPGASFGEMIALMLPLDDKSGGQRIADALGASVMWAAVTANCVSAGSV